MKYQFKHTQMLACYLSSQRNSFSLIKLQFSYHYLTFSFAPIIMTKAIRGLFVSKCLVWIIINYFTNYLCSYFLVGMGCLSQCSSFSGNNFFQLCLIIWIDLLVQSVFCHAHSLNPGSPSFSLLLLIPTHLINPHHHSDTTHISLPTHSHVTYVNFSAVFLTAKETYFCHPHRTTY